MPGRRAAVAAVLVPAAFLFVGWPLLGAAAQTRDSVRAPAIGTARISGHVVGAGGSSGPIRRAIVTIRADELGVPRSVVCDDRGSFSFDRLPAGRFTISATKAAYLTTSFGSKRPGRPGTPLALAAGEQVADITLALVRGGVIAGTIRTASGAPASAIRVSAARIGEVASRSLASFIAPVSDSALTDDRGAYRIFGLPPGDYTVVAVPSGSRSTGEVYRRSTSDVDAILRDLQSRGSAPAAPAVAPPPPVFGVSPIFFPGTSNAAEAAAVSIAAGGSREDVDFVVDLVASATIEGTVARSGDLTGAPLTLVISGAGQATPLALPFAPRLATPPGADGRFRYVNVTPGHYTISVLARPAAPAASGRGSASAGAPLYWASAEVDVNGQDISGLSLSFQPAITVTGRLAFDAATLAPPADVSSVQIRLETLPGRGATAVSNNTAYGGLQRTVFARVGPDGAFEAPGLTPGPYRFGVNGASLSGWWLRSVVVGGRDVLDEPFEIRPALDLSGIVVTFTDRHTEIGGILQTAAAQPVAEYSVVAIPASRALWTSERRTRSTRPATDGRFAFKDLPAGDYLLAAVADLDPEDLARPAFLEQLASAGVPVTLADGEKKQQDLRVRGVTPR